MWNSAKAEETVGRDREKGLLFDRFVLGTLVVGGINRYEQKFENRNLFLAHKEKSTIGIQTSSKTLSQHLAHKYPTNITPDTTSIVHFRAVNGKFYLFPL